MSLRDRIVDAELLWRNGRTEGALLSILLAVEVTARKRYPRGTKSKTRVSKKTGKPQKMGGGEAFCTFLNEEIRRHGAPPMRLLMNKPPSDPPKFPRDRKMPPMPEWDSADIEACIKAERKWHADFKKWLADRERRVADFKCAIDAWSKMADKYLMDLEQVFWKLCRCGICHEGGVSPQVRFIEQSGLYSSLKSQKLKLSKTWIRLLAMTVILAKENEGVFADRIRRFWVKGKARSST